MHRSDLPTPETDGGRRGSALRWQLLGLAIVAAGAATLLYAGYQSVAGNDPRIRGALLGGLMAAMATALGISPRAVVELLPGIEAAMVRGITKQNSQTDLSRD